MFLKYIYLLIFFVSVSFSKPYVTTNYNYYEINPNNSHKLEENMDKNSPISLLGSIRHGTVNWKLKYYYKREQRGAVCKIAEVITKVDVLYTVPRISNKYKTSKKVKKAFKRYYSILEKYLHNQKEFAVKAAEEIEKKLMELPSSSANCEIVKSDVKNIANKIIKKYKKKNKNYEIKTYEGFLDSVQSEKL